MERNTHDDRLSYFVSMRPRLIEIPYHLATVSRLTNRDDSANEERGSRMINNKEEDGMSLRWAKFSSVFLRYALGVGFLSAVADRLGLWGAFGQPNVEWGNFSRFLEYTQTLNWWVPARLIPLLGVIATGAETLFGLLLIFGWHTRATALLAGLLLLTFALAMTLALGIKAPLNFAVFTGVGGAFLLASCKHFPFTVDQLLLHRIHSEGYR